MNKKRNIYLMYAMALLQDMVFYGPVATLYRQAAGVGILQMAVIESLSTALCIGLELPWGILADKIGYRKTMIFCCTLYFISKIVFWKADGFGTFLAERLMMSVVISGLSGVDESILYLSDQENAQSVFGIYNSLSMAGLLIASAVYSVWIGEDYRLAGFLTVISYGAAAVLSLGLREVKEKTGGRCLKKQAESFGEELRGVLKNSSLLLFLAAFALFQESHQTITVFLSQLQYVRCGLSGQAMGMIYMVMTILGLAGGFSARLTKKAGEKRMIDFLFLTVSLACLVSACSSQAAVSVAALCLIRICHSLAQPLLGVIQNRQVQAEGRATSLSIHAVIMDSIAIMTNLIFGKLADICLPAAMAAGTGFCFLGWLILHRRKIREGLL